MHLSTRTVIKLFMRPVFRKTLKNSHFAGKDQGVNIRHKVTEMIEFIQDDDRLRDERKKAKKNKDKYVGMSSDSMGFRGGSRFETGGSWGNGGGGGWREDRSSSNPSGFRDHSDEEGSRGPSPDVNEYRDEDHDYIQAPASAGVTSKKFSDLSESSRPASTSSNAKNVSKAKTVKKPIDLGAAATFAAQASASTTIVQKQPVTTAASLDLFGEPESTPVVAPPTEAKMDLFGTDEDDFNPRGGTMASVPVSAGGDSNANGAFGNFEAAFGETSKNGGDGFADFSSAFGSTSAAATTSLPAPPTPPPSSSNTSFDLMGGSQISPQQPQQAAASSNIDLLGGLVMNNGPPPPLVGMSSLGSLASVPAPASNVDFFNQPSVMMNPMATPMTTSNNNNHNVTSTVAAASKQPQKPTMWDNVGNVNINLDNLSLKGGNGKGKGLPMNAMVTPNSSPQKALPGGGLGAMGPPPLQSVQPPSQSSFDLNDLLN